MGRVTFALLLAAGCLTTPALDAQPTSRAAPPIVVPNDNRVAAGRMVRGTWEVRLVALRARWHPAGESDSSVVALALGEEGGPPRIPAPLLRVPRGTRMRVVVRNTLDDSLFLCIRGGVPCRNGDSVRVAAGASDTLEFSASDTGTFIYYAETPRLTAVGRRPVGRPQMAGAFVVDGGQRQPDRVIVLNGYVTVRPGHERDTTFNRFFQGINGRMWPATERLHYTVGDSVRWRIVNATANAHPMHLHGFYFRVDARGDGRSDTTYTRAAQRLAVTELVPSMGSVKMTWVPQRAGNWLLHCHKAFHVNQARLTDLRNGPRRFADQPAPQHASPVLAGSGMATQVHGAHASGDMMAGMIVGIEVRPSVGEEAADPSTATNPAARGIRVLAQERPRYFGEHPAFGFAVHAGSLEPSADSLRVPARPILLTRGEPVAITVVNRLGEPTAVHWHGIELESFFDGVGGWSGWGTRVAPMIAPGDSFVAHFTPPRAGSFMFHAHADEIRQLGAGLVGPLIVLEPGRAWNPETDHALVLSQHGPGVRPVTVNGDTAPPPLVLRAGVAHRFRVFSILPHEDVELRLLRDGVTATWRALAKDGAELPPSQAIEQPAARLFGTGETLDFELVPAAGEMTLEFGNRLSRGEMKFIAR
jgi:manganese oxidase